MTHRHTDTGRIRALMRQGDPAAGESLSPEEVARIRHRLDAEAARSEGRLPRAERLGWAALAAVLLAAVVLRLVTSPPPPPAAPATPVPAEVAANVEDRQVLFVTREGTRIVWVLSPDLNL